jgi:hypothetical protein
MFIYEKGSDDCFHTTQIPSFLALCNWIYKGAETDIKWIKQDVKSYLKEISSLKLIPGDTIRLDLFHIIYLIAIK